MFILMQNGATPHYLTVVQDFLNGRLPGQRIGRDAPIASPPPPQSSTDLTTVDFLFWGFIEIMVYLSSLPITQLQRRAIINAATEEVTPEMLVRV